ncbi:MAG TPA: hypothetical protein VGW10_02875 [Solirubrobacteraceae bacterium]|nr:hypothetical protein [Solirubrobacteraceae bacterium]
MRNDIDIRIADEGDAAVLRIARLDSADPFAGRALVASVAGREVAAVAYDGTAVVADPFVPTADVVALLRERSEQLRGVRVARRLRRWHRGERSERRVRPASVPVLRPRAT